MSVDDDLRDPAEPDDRRPWIVVRVLGVLAAGIPVVLAAPVLFVVLIAGRAPDGRTPRLIELVAGGHELAQAGAYPVLGDLYEHLIWARIRWPLAVLLVFGASLVIVSFFLSRRDARETSDSTASSRGRKIAVGVGAVVLVGAVVGLGTLASQPGSSPGAADETWSGHDPGVVINELVASNGSVGTDEDGDNSDWIELFNPTDESVDLDGFFLSDDDDEPDRWRLPQVTIEPGGHLLVWASGKDRAETDGELHTDFAIAQDGEPVTLTAPDGETVLDRIPAGFVPRDVSLGRDPNDLQRLCYFYLPSPGAANVQRCFDDTRMGAPELSAPSGFHPEPFGLEIDADGDATIVYTLDGSYPDLETNPDRTLVYDGPLRIEDRTPEPERLATIDAAIDGDLIPGDPPTPVPELDEPIQKATVVRARTRYGAETVATYFVGDVLVREELPVMSLVLDEEYLFDHDTGIYVAGRVHEENLASDDPDLTWAAPANYNQRGRRWERPFADDLRRSVVFEYCPGPGGPCEFQTNLGLRIHGQATRAFQQKSFRLYARNDYSSRVFDYPFFGPHAPDDHRRLILRNSGQDQVRLTFMDAYLQTLMEHFDADTQAYQPAVLFINGGYWGIYNVRERYDRHYVHAVHGADPEAVEIVDGGPMFAEGGPQLLEFMQSHDMSDPSALRRVEQEHDLDSFFDFMIAHIYTANSDWPGNNVRLWREVDGPDAIGEGVRDGRWRWMIFDLDAVGDWGASDIDYDVFDVGLAPSDDPGHLWGLPLFFHRLMDNDDARHRFVTRFADHINTAFEPERSLEVLDDVVGVVEAEIDLHLDRWETRELDSWQQNLETLRDFMRQRPGVQRRHLVDRYDLGGTATLHVSTDADQGLVRVNSLRIDASTPGVDDPSRWQGEYFTGLPIRVEALPLAGHEFVRWEGLPDGADSSPRIDVVLDGDLEVSAVFSPS